MPDELIAQLYGWGVLLTLLVGTFFLGGDAASRRK